ncbi:MAG TPA: mechanosensitive ion channel domain-containing protein [Nitrosopumilaceae archaeon]|nr:mechanosensitive ion channel domain-containing protein [Nitrosopumilaceae archaeon]
MAFEDILYAIISIIISAAVFLTIRTIINIKLKSLGGAQKILGLSTIGIVVVESAYLAINFDLLTIASEIIATLGVAFALVVWALQNNLKNMVAGIGIYLNPEIEVGDIIEVDENKGVIIELHLTKITALTEDGVRLFIPTQKIHQEVVRIYHKEQKTK